MTRHFTTSTGARGISRSFRRYVVVDRYDASTQYRTDVLYRARKVARQYGSWEVIDLDLGFLDRPRTSGGPV